MADGLVNGMAPQVYTVRHRRPRIVNLAQIWQGGIVCRTTEYISVHFTDHKAASCSRFYTRQHSNALPLSFH